ncbi:MAG: hypothetical protein LBV80_05125 [Deltaproteobacteria bacterium]|jgi:4-amino-4-deoxy-L-arabinose transferase-like glycosyltransferase|nr:hypothetical protein [Deltaproteobacteria bacterium]
MNAEHKGDPDEGREDELIDNSESGLIEAGASDSPKAEGRETGFVLVDKPEDPENRDSFEETDNHTSHENQEFSASLSTQEVQTSLPMPVDAPKLKKTREAPPKFPPLKVEPQAPATLLSRLYDLLALAAPLTLTALALIMVASPLLEARLLWFPEETILAGVLSNLPDQLNSEWLILRLNGEVYFDSPPLYFWFLAGIGKLLGLPFMQSVVALLPGVLTDGLAGIMLLGTALSALLLLWALLFMARGVAGLDWRGCFAAGSVLLGLFLFCGALNYCSMDLLFAALVITAQCFMFQALRRHESMPRMGLGFACAALAFLAGGPLGLVLPLVTAVIFAFWQGRPWRLFRKDFLLGFVFSLLPAIFWIGSIWADGHHEVVARILDEQFVGPLRNLWSYPGAWWYYCLLPMLFMPWVLLIFFPHWRGMFSRETRQAVKSAFRGDHQGISFVWISFVCALAAFFLLSEKQPLNLLTVAAPFAIITGRMALGLSPLRNLLLQRCFAVICLLLALICAIVPVYLSGKATAILGWLDWLGLPVLGIDLGGVFIIAALLLAAGCLLLGAVNSRRPEGSLLIMLLLAVGLSWPLGALTAPSLDQLLSPQRVSRTIAAYAEQDYTPLALGTNPAPFAYYSGLRIEMLERANEQSTQLETGETVRKPWDVRNPLPELPGAVILLVDAEALPSINISASLAEENAHWVQSIPQNWQLLERFSLGGEDFALLVQGGLLSQSAR